MDWNCIDRFLTWKRAAIILISLLIIGIILILVSSGSSHSTGKRCSKDTTESHESKSPSVATNGSAIVSTITTWPNGIVPYELDEYFTEAKLVFTKAMKFISDKTCVKFVQKTKKHSNWVKFSRNDEICYNAQIGFRPLSASSGQPVQIGLDCLTSATLQRVLALILGLGYEGTRPDRHFFLEYDPTRKECVERAPLLIRKGPDTDSKNEIGLLTTVSTEHTEAALGIIFDFASHMLLAKKCFHPLEFWDTKLGSIDGTDENGEGKLSVLDLEKLNAMYNCKGCNSYRFIHIRKIHGMEVTHSFESFNPIEAGVDINGEDKLHVCRKYHAGSLLIGKMKLKDNEQNCWIVGHYGQEYIFGRGYEVMTNPLKAHFEWTEFGNETGQPVDLSHAVVGGRTNDREPVYIGKCSLKTDGRFTVLSGSYLESDRGVLKVPFGGTHHECATFQLLTCK